MVKKGIIRIFFSCLNLHNNAIITFFSTFVYIFTKISKKCRITIYSFIAHYSLPLFRLYYFATEANSWVYTVSANKGCHYGIVSLIKIMRLPELIIPYRR